jgi:hypothetical protein
MKLLSIALMFVGAGALACPADDVKDAQSDMKDKAAAEAKAPVRATTPTTKALASKKTQQSTKVADKSANEALRKSSL